MELELSLRRVISNEDHGMSPLVDDTEVMGDDLFEPLLDLNDDVDTLSKYTSMLEDATIDVVDLSTTSDDIRSALDDESYTGMDRVAVGQLNRRLESMSGRFGFTITDSTFSTESFNGVDNRRESEVALEGLVETIKNMWEKLKEAFIKLWENIKKFWEKHLSTISRLIKRLEKLLKSARTKEGSPSGVNDKGESRTASHSLQTTFPSSKDISANLLSDFTKNQQDMMDGTLTVVLKYVEWAMKISTTVKNGGEIPLSNIEEVNFGDEDHVLVGGSYGSIKVESEDGEDSKVVFEWKSYGGEKQKERKLIPGDSNELEKVIIENLELLTRTKDFGKKFNNLDSKVKSLTRDITAMVNQASEVSDSNEVDKENVKDKNASIKEAIKLQQQILQLLPNVNNRVIKLNIQCGKGVADFAKDSLKTYK